MKRSCSPGFSRGKESEAGLVNMERSRDQVRLRREDVTILADARDFAGLLELAQDFVQSHPHAALPAENFRQFDFVERPIFGRAEHPQDLVAQLGCLRFHDASGQSPREVGRARAQFSTGSAVWHPAVLAVCGTVVTAYRVSRTCSRQNAGCVRRNRIIGAP